MMDVPFAVSPDQNGRAAPGLPSLRRQGAAGRPACAGRDDLRSQGVASPARCSSGCAAHRLTRRRTIASSARTASGQSCTFSPRSSPKEGNHHGSSSMPRSESAPHRSEPGQEGIAPPPGAGPKPDERRGCLASRHAHRTPAGLTGGETRGQRGVLPRRRGRAVVLSLTEGQRGDARGARACCDWARHQVVQRWHRAAIDGRLDRGAGASGELDGGEMTGRTERGDGEGPVARSFTRRGNDFGHRTLRRAA